MIVPRPSSLARLVVLLINALVISPSDAAPSEDHGAIAIRQELLEMATPLRLMCVAAHPDDEDGATLAYYNRGYGVQTSIMLANWGEGGQNEIGPELYEELGVIRSRETLEAAKVVGTENVYCLNQKDFGYSKTIEETWRFWNRDQALERAVRILRTERPHVVITNHRMGQGHGNHQAMAELIAEAVVAAGSDAAFPNQISNERLRPWGETRLFQRCRHHEGDPFEHYDVAVPVGELEAIRGFTYQEIASEALNRHRSQGIKGVWGYVNLLRRESPLTHFTLRSGERPEGTFEDLFDGLEGAWWTHDEPIPFGDGSSDVGRDEAVASALSQALSSALNDPRRAGDSIRRAIDELARLNADIDANPKWSRESPENVIAAKAKWTEVEVEEYQSEVIDRFANIGEMQRRLEGLLADCLGLELVLRTDLTDCVAGETFVVEAEIHNRGRQPASISGISARVPSGWRAEILDASQELLAPLASKEFEVRVTAPEDAAATLPETEELYRHPTPWKPNIELSALAKVGGSIGALHGAARIEVAPDWNIAVAPPRRVVNLASSAPSEFTVHLTANSLEGGTGTLTVRFPDGQEVRRDVALSKRGSLDESIDWSVSGALTEGKREVVATLASQGREFTGRSEVALAQIRIPENLRVGIVQSYDRTLPDALTTLGISHALLTEEDLETGDLGRYETILIDIRGYLEREDLRANNERVLEYVKQGGRLVVFYHKSFDWNDADPPYAPYPLTLSRDRVTEEDAPVTILVATHTLLSHPNATTLADWEGWIHERGLYFPDPYDPAYQELVAMSDAGSQPLRSGILIAGYGTGTYIYTPLSWYRQLQAGIPGAYRLFVNLITPARSVSEN